jgi:hypothetical protein
MKQTNKFGAIDEEYEEHHYKVEHSFPSKYNKQQ